MDQDNFDRLARTAAQSRSRRGALRLLLGGAVGAGTLTTLGRAADAKKRHKRPKDRCSGPTGICNADPTACGRSATGETCGCERAVEGNTFCADGASPCPDVVECTSTNRKNDPTSCRNLRGFHFVCQEAKRNSVGQFCGCGFGTQTGRVCVAACDNPDQ